MLKLPRMRGGERVLPISKLLYGCSSPWKCRAAERRPSSPPLKARHPQKCHTSVVYRVTENRERTVPRSVGNRVFFLYQPHLDVREWC